MHGPFSIVLLVRWRRSLKQRRSKRACSESDFTVTLTLTERDERRILSGQDEWFDDLRAHWDRLISLAERYETAKGHRRLKLKGLVEDDLGVFDRLFYCAKKAAETDGEVNRIMATEDRLMEQLASRVARQNVRYHWYLELTPEERADYRRRGEGLRTLIRDRPY